MKTKIGVLVFVASLCIAGCASSPRKNAAALDGDFSGNGFSGSFAVIRAAGDIPHVPESAGKQARYSQIERDQVLYFDAHCQAELYYQLPGWAQAIVEEGGWAALAIAVGQGAFASAFPGAEVARYVLAGLGYGAFAGANTGRYRQEGSEKSSVGYCVWMQVWDANGRYGILDGIHIAPWSGNGKTKLRDAIDSTTPPLDPSPATGTRRPPP